MARVNGWDWQDRMEWNGMIGRSEWNDHGSYAGTGSRGSKDARLLTGHGTFVVDDVTRPGMLHACFVRSPFAQARINGIDSGTARSYRVCAVFTAADPNPDVRGGLARSRARTFGHPRPPLAEGEVKFVGDPVALVVADSRYIAEDAIELVDVDYMNPAGDRRLHHRGRRRGRVHEAYPDNVAGGLAGGTARRRDLRRRGARGQRTHHQQAYVPVPMETADWWSNGWPPPSEPPSGLSTQTPHELRAFAARLLGIPAQRVRVVMRDTGGGFGQKVVPMREDMCIMLAARKGARGTEVDRRPPRRT